MWTFADHTTTAEKAQKRFNDALTAQKQQLDNLKSSAIDLINTIKSETNTQYEKMEAYLKLQKIFPEVFKNMDIEKIKLMDLVAYEKLLAEAKTRREIVGAKTSLVLKTNAYSEAKERYSKTSSRNSNILTYYAQMKAAEEDMKLAQKQVSEIEKIQSEANKQKGKDGKKVVVENKEFWDKQKKDAETALDSIASKQRVLLDAGMFDGIDASVVANYKAQNKLLKEAQKELKVYDTSGKSEKQQESAAEKLRKEQEKYALLLDKQKREQERMKTDSQHELEQIEINGLEEGSEKVLRQRQLNHAKELEAIKREVEDKKLKAIEEARSAFEANPDNKKKVFNAEDFIKSEPVKKQFATFDNVAEAKTNTENTKYNRGDDLKGLLDEYQDYTDKRLAIETKFNNDLATLNEQRETAVKNGDTKQVEQIDRAKAQATTDKGKALIGLDYEQLKQSPEYVRAFENLKQTSSETLNSLLSQLENAKGTAAKVLSPDQLREYTTTIQDIMNELDERNPWQALSDKKQELADAEQELAQAQIELENARQMADAVKGGAKIESGVSSSKYNPKTGKIDSSKAYLTEAQALDKVKAKTDNYNKSKDKVAEKSAKVKKSEKDVTDQIDELSKAISDVGNSIGGPAGEIISLIGDIGSFTMMAINGVKMAADTSAQAISTVEKASVILMIISAAIQLATKVMSFFAADYSDYNESKENYEKYVEVLDVIISKQKELIETLTGEAAVRASKDALDLIEKQAQAARNLGKERLNAGASAGSHSIGVRIKDSMSESGWNEALNAIGAGDYNKIKDGRMTGLFDLSVQQLNKLQMEAPEFWAKLDEDVREYLEQIIACNENAEELKGILNESLTGVSFDSVSENFLDALSDMDTSAADFADNFSSYMQKAILNTMMAKTYEKRLNDWYESFANANKDGDIDSLDYDKLQKDWEGIVSDALLDRDKLKDLFGWTSGESTSQDSTNGGFETMSQDTGEELNGRFTALQIAGEEIRNQSILQSQSLNLLTFKADAILTVNTEVRNIADETRTLIANSYLELQDIRENTGAIVKPIIQMQKDMEEVKKNTSKL